MGAPACRPGLRRWLVTDLSYSVSRRPNSTGGGVAARRRSSTFSSDEIIAAIRLWHNSYGEFPKMIDWEPHRARRAGQEWRAERFESGHWPSTRVVRRQFRSFNEAIQAAGFDPRPAPTRQRPNLLGPEAVLEAMFEWVRRYGDIPTMADWDPARARRLNQDWRIARFHQGDWPSARSVALHFGSFAKAAVAAGLVHRPRGVHHHERQDERSHNRLTAAKASATARTPGIADLAAGLRELAVARARRDPTSVHAALIQVAGAALAWAEVFGEE